MKQYIKDNKVYNTPVKIKNGNSVIITNDEEIILKNGYEIYVPVKIETVQPEKQQTNIDLQIARFNKRKVKNLLMEYGLWNKIRHSLKPSQYEDLLLSEDFAFDDPLFRKSYQLIKTQFDAGTIKGIPSGVSIDDLLLTCVKD